MDILFREMTASDYDAAYTLWQGMPGIALSGADERNAITAFLVHNPHLCFIAEKDGTLIGTILCGNDGRRGYLYHLAVHPKFRGLKIASRLVDVALNELQKRGIQKCHLFVVADNVDGKKFWQKTGWEFRQDIGVFSKSI